jgi:Activator of Hsp90 ATPase homolog 1-like protein
LEDKPENYVNVAFALRREGDDTVLTLTQDNNRSEESKKHSEDNWGTVLEGMKKMLENE